LTFVANSSILSMHGGNLFIRSDPARSTQFSPLGQTQQGNGESHQRHNKENGNANLVLNVHEGACKRHDYENSYRDTADRARGRL
jgi:hypothetical protein